MVEAKHQTYFQECELSLQVRRRRRQLQGRMRGKESSIQKGVLRSSNFWDGLLEKLQCVWYIIMSQSFNERHKMIYSEDKM